MGVFVELSHKATKCANVQLAEAATPKGDKPRSQAVRHANFGTEHVLKEILRGLVHPPPHSLLVLN